MNGTLYTVATASDFPQANPLFHLVSVTAHSAKISIAGGSYSSGAATVTLKENKPVTLVNTADGTRYTLILKPLGTSVPGGSTNSSAGSGTSSSGSGSSGSGTTTTTPSSTTVTLPSLESGAYAPIDGSNVEVTREYVRVRSAGFRTTTVTVRSWLP